MIPNAVNQLPKFVLTAILISAAILLATSPLAQETPVGGQAVSVTDKSPTGLTLTEVEAA